MQPKIEPKAEPKMEIKIEPNKITPSHESIISQTQFPNADVEIQNSNEAIKSYMKYQTDVWSLLSMFKQDLTREEILQDEISRLEENIENNAEELEFLRDDLTYATSKFEQIIIKSDIKLYKSLFRYDQEKLISLHNNGIDGLEKYESKEIQNKIDKHLERIQRLENLKNKNFDYLSTDNQIIKYVSQYKGKDKKGDTLEIKVLTHILVKYGRDALTKSNPFLDMNWIKTNSVLYFGTEPIDDFDIDYDRYKAVHYAFFSPSSKGFKTVFSFGFDTETYEIVAYDKNSEMILKELYR